MSTEKSPSPNEVRTFVILLKHYGLYQPEELYKVICPFHDDKNASMQININKAFFYCYAECGAKGSSLELYRSFQQLEHPDREPPSDLKCLLAIKKLVKQAEANGDVPPIYNYTNNTSYSVESQKVSYREGLTQARDFYYNLPETNWYKPGIEEGTEAKHYMKHRGFSAKLLKQAGAKCSFNRWYPIVFPMFENGIFRGYVMRTFDPEVEANRKYMYNRGFKRERTLAGTFGTRKASGSSVEKQTVVIVEGFLDKLKANQLGIQNVVAILGWKLTQTQIKKLQKAGVKTIICGTDNDEAGRKGYRYMKRIAPHTGFSVKRLRYPKGIKDMGDVKPNTPAAQMVLNQIHNFGGK